MYCRISEDSMNHSDPASLPSRLRALPGYTPPPGGWSRLSRRLDARRRRFVAAGAGLALAASLLAAVGLVLVQPQSPGPAAPQGGARTMTAAATPSGRDVAELIRASQRLEQRLARARPQVAVWDTPRVRTVESLESNLRLVDAQIAYADGRDTERLWRERVELMDALVTTHESQAPALHYASYQY